MPRDNGQTSDKTRVIEGEIDGTIGKYPPIGEPAARVPWLT